MPDPRIHPIVSTEDYAAGVGGVSAIVVAANPQRADLEITNDLDVVVYISRSDPAVVGEGIKLIHNGSYSMDTQNLFLGAFYAICDAATVGNILYWCPLAVEKTCNAGDTFRVPIDGLVLDLA